MKQSRILENASRGSVSLSFYSAMTRRDQEQENKQIVQEPSHPSEHVSG